LGRDPKFDQAGRYARKPEGPDALHAYWFTRNDPANRWDYLGLFTQWGIRRPDQDADPRQGNIFGDDGYGGDAFYGGLWAEVLVNWAVAPGTRPPGGGGPAPTVPSPGRQNMPALFQIVKTSFPALNPGSRLDRARDASGLTETDLHYAALMLAIASRESGFDPNAKNSQSTATGLYQILNGTKTDLAQRVAPGFGSDFSGDWRLDPGMATTGATYVLLDKIASAGGDLRGGLKNYRGDQTAVGDAYADTILARRDAILDFAKRFEGGDLGLATQSDWNELIGIVNGINIRPPRRPGEEDE
jgi:hypothetical protein